MNFFVKFFKSFTDIKAYQQFAKEPFGRAFGFLILATLILSLAAIMPGIIQFNRGINQVAGLFEETPLDFSLQNGELSVNVDMPFYHTYEDSTTIIDTSGGTSASVLEDYDKAVLFTATRMLIKDGNSTAEVSFQALPNISLSTRFLATFFQFFKWAIPLVVIFSFVITLVVRLVQALLVAVVAVILAAILKAGLGFGNVLAMSIYALTLPAIIGVFHSWLPFTIPGLYFNIVFFSVAGLYMVLALLKITKTPIEDGSELAGTEPGE
ncbi:MAG: DUF1189 domain-containing protein [Firmicutes bacterium]|nr:DUF1189 domain-containing protein [Bacillota bacterium]